MHTQRTYLLVAVVAVLALTGASHAETLHVGPGKAYDRPSAAIAAAKGGDIVEIAAADYVGDVCLIKANRLTLRGVLDAQGHRPRILAAGKHIQGKAIWVIQGADTTVENIEFRDCRVPDHNGAGIRSEGNNLTVRNCRFYNCQDTILSGKQPDSTITIEFCEFAYCSLSPTPGTHNLYIGECKKLVYRFNYSHHAKYANLVKSRARENWICYNRITDEADGTGSYQIDLSNGGLAYVIGNVFHKGANAQNTTFIAYGQEGMKYEQNGLYVVNNTAVSNYRDGTAPSEFIHVRGAKADVPVVARNNLVIGRKVELCKAPGTPVLEGNVQIESVDQAKLARPEAMDFRLLPGSPCIDKGVECGKAGDVSLRPEFQYVHPQDKQARPENGKIDVGAFEFQASAGEAVP